MLQPARAEWQPWRGICGRDVPLEGHLQLSPVDVLFSAPLPLRTFESLIFP